MARPWGKLHAPMLSHRKFMRMSRAERGDWLTLVLAAINSTKDEDLGTQADVKSILKSYGNARPADTISQMLILGLLDLRIADDHLLLHDWADHQPDDPTGAKRKAAERAAAKGSQPTESVRGQSQDSPATVTGQSADSPQTVTRPARTLSRESRSQDGEERRGEEITPQPPASGGRRSRANGTSPRAQAKAETDRSEAASKAKRYRTSQRQLAYARGAISETQLADMTERDASLEEIPDREAHLASLQADGPSWFSGTPETAEAKP